ncbi:TetR/AcrR family transcriptional regulator [Nocardia canadensis]|uniref:TetR/AcrR family transcriptional regulator n=1 Tax=Nocardia canadensis TaxID=3065238 RepID=UPI0029305AA9|nr:TetR family transcriptional regulator [Nocardia canadensis]
MGRDRLPRKRPIRADALRNRRHILVAARELFAERGLAVSLDQVAHKAALGVGTVYRHFSTKQDLIHDAFEDVLADLVSHAEAAAVNPDPWQGIVEFFDAAFEYAAPDRGLAQLLIVTHDDLRETRDSLEAALVRLIERARAAGAVRDGVGIGDLYVLTVMIDAVGERVSPIDPDAWRRYLDLALDGLRADGTPRHRIRGRAPKLDEIHAVQRSSSDPERKGAVDHRV